MTPAQVDRAKTLRDALRDLPRLKKYNGQKNPALSGLALLVTTEPNYCSSTHVDKATGRKIIAASEKIIRTELRQLGVTPYRRRARRKQ